MFGSPARVTLLVCAAVLATRLAAADPVAPKFRAEYTAFPDLKPPPPREEKAPDGTVRRVPGIWTEFPPLAPLPADAPPLRKARYEQARVGLDYFGRPPRGGWAFLADWHTVPEIDWLSVVPRVFPIAAELEAAPANRVMWYEARVRVLKEIEAMAFGGARKKEWGLPPQWLNVVRFYRLGAEIELLELLAEVKRAAPAAPPPMARPQPPGDVIVRAPEQKRPVPLERAPAPHRTFPFGYTAFPELRWDFGPGTRQRRDDPDARVGRPPTDIPVLPADAPQLCKLQRAAVIEAFAVLDAVCRPMLIAGTGYPFYSEFADETYRLAADLETRPSDRVTWYEARVHALKGWNAAVELRVENRTVPPYKFHVASFVRLQTEVDLLRLEAEVANGGGAKGDVGKREEIKEENRDGWAEGRRVLNVPQCPTAFPDLSGPTREVKEKRADGLIIHEWKGEVPRPKLPALRADAPTLRKLRFEQASEGLEALDRFHDELLNSRGPCTDPRIYSDLLARVYTVAGNLEDEPAKRVAWYEQRVRDGKRFEHVLEQRVKEGSTPTWYHAVARIVRLQAEMELLKLKEAIAKAK